MGSRDVIKSYEKIADWFDTNRNKSLIEKPYLDIILQNISPGGTVLDLGCGSGEPIASYLIQNGYIITGIDGSRKMIALCQSRFPAMRWLVADMRSLNLTQKFDVIIAWHSLFHLDLESQRNMFSHFRSYMNRNGLLIFTSGLEEGEEWSDGGNPSLNGGESLYHASLSSTEYQNLLNQYGFEILIHQTQDPQCGNATIWVAKYVG